MGSFYEDHFDDNMDYYDGDIKDDAEAEDEDLEDDVEAEDEDVENDINAEDEDIEEDVKVEGINFDEYPYRRPLDWSCITDVSSRSGPPYDKHGREIPKLGSFHNLELGSLTPCTKGEDDIDARLAILDKKLMIHSFRNLTLENLEDEDERMEGNESEYFPQYIRPSNKGKQDLFREWMDSIECLDAYVPDKPIDMEIDGESTDYMNEDPTVLMLREKGLTRSQLPLLKPQPS